MGIFGRGIAFNNSFFPRGPIRFNCYHRPMPMIPRGPLFGGMSISENFTYKTNFWDALSAGLMAFAQTKMMFGGMGAAGSMGGAAGIAQANPQGPNNAENNDNLKQLRNLFQAKKVNIEETSKGKFTATDENGNIIGKNLSFEDMSDALDKYNKVQANDAVNVANVTDNKDTKIAGKDSAPEDNIDANIADNKVANTIDDDKVKNKVANNKSADVKKSNDNTQKSGSKDGWYKAANDKSSNVNQTHIDGKGKSAQQVTSAILGTKLTGVLNKSQQEELCKIIIKNNPSVFNSDGKPKANANYAKLDVPTMAWIENHFTLSHGSKVAKHDDIYTNDRNKTIRGDNGYYVKIDSKGNKTYFDKNAKKISEEEFKKKCPNIYNNINKQNKTNNYTAMLQGYSGLTRSEWINNG